jgi:hypothetical protein
VTRRAELQTSICRMKLDAGIGSGRMLTTVTHYVIRVSMKGGTMKEITKCPIQRKSSSVRSVVESPSGHRDYIQARRFFR